MNYKYEMGFEKKSWWKRLNCLHYWVETHIPADLVFLNGKFLYRCRECGKEKYYRHAPVNPVSFYTPLDIPPPTHTKLPQSGSKGDKV